jgi:hypothetical protein
MKKPGRSTLRPLETSSLRQVAGGYGGVAEFNGTTVPSTLADFSATCTGLYGGTPVKEVSGVACRGFSNESHGTWKPTW